MGYWGAPLLYHAVPTNPTNTDVSTVDTVRQMIVLARGASTSSRVIQAVSQILKSPNQQPKELARAIYWWVKSHIKFVEDEPILARELGYTDVHQELLISPDRLLQMPTPMGDCDDFAMLTASMLLASGIPAKFVTIASDPDEPFRFSHVYAMANIPGGWIGMDTSHGAQLGWEYRGTVYRRAEWIV
jgi:transglutaminase-like putative cysteine protease